MTSPDPDRLRYARIAGAVARHALGWRLTADEEAAAVAELTEAAAGRADLLAERAGTALGFGEGRPDAARYRQIAELCIAAGADPALIERWIKVGRERAATAAAIPYAGPPRPAVCWRSRVPRFQIRAVPTQYTGVGLLWSPYGAIPVRNFYLVLTSIMTR